MTVGGKETTWRIPLAFDPGVRVYSGVLSFSLSSGRAAFSFPLCGFSCVIFRVGCPNDEYELPVQQQDVLGRPWDVAFSSAS